MKGCDVLQTGRQDGDGKGDGQAIVQRTFEVRRFTREEHERGDTAGWCLDVGWFERAGWVVWAWFRREAEDGETIELS